MDATTEPPPRDTIIPASDGFGLAATIFACAGEPEAVVIVGAATAVHRGFYSRFAAWLAATAPLTVLTFDYRGIGQSRPSSLKGFEARMRDWGERDIVGILAAAQALAPGKPVRWIGHSFSGFGPGFASNQGIVERLLAVATMSGYWGHMGGLEGLKVAAMMGLAVPAMARLRGYAPGIIFSGAQDLPKGIALEFSHWCMSPGFLFDDATLPSAKRMATFAAPMRFCQPLDDPWCTDPALAALMARFTGARLKTLWRADPVQAGGPIGHVGFFRDRFRETLWREARDWITAPLADIAGGATSAADQAA